MPTPARAPSCQVPLGVHLRTTLTNTTPLRLAQLPQNWSFVRPLLALAIPFPSRLYRPEQMRRSAQHVVTAGHPLWWGMGGEAEAEDQNERNHRRALLEPGVEGLKERLEEQRRESKARMKKTFGEGKVSLIASRGSVAFGARADP